MRILVVEDDHELADILIRALKEQLYHVDVAYDGESAQHLALSEDFSLVILDLMIPKIDGVTVCRNIRSSCFTSNTIPSDMCARTGSTSLYN